MRAIGILVIVLGFFCLPVAAFATYFGNEMLAEILVWHLIGSLYFTASNIVVRPLAMLIGRLLPAWKESPLPDFEHVTLALLLFGTSVFLYVGYFGPEPDLSLARDLHLGFCRTMILLELIIGLRCGAKRRPFNFYLHPG